MAEVKEFQGLIYNTDKAGDPALLFCPPYDVISPEDKEYFHGISPFNIIHAELGRSFDTDNEENNKYTRANALLNQWTKDRVLLTDKASFYLYLQEFTWDKKVYKRPGIVSAVKIEDKEKIILPHEKTLSKPKEDRFLLLSATRTNISQIFGFFSGPDSLILSSIEETLKTNPYYRFTDRDNVTHALYRIPDKFFAQIKKALAKKIIFIADGHHRYEAALKYRDFMRSKEGLVQDAPWKYVMMTLVPIEPDLLILPIHRIVKLPDSLPIAEIFKSLSPYFNIKPFSSATSLLSSLRKVESSGAFGMITNIGEYLISVKSEVLPLIPYTGSDTFKTLDTNILQHFVFERAFNIKESEFESMITFTSKIDDAIETPKKDKYSVSFILRPVNIETIKVIALNSEIMPQKTSYFFPKVWTGLVMRRL